jgi:hypothetical protein
VDQDCDTLIDGVISTSTTESRVTTDISSSSAPSLSWTGSEYGLAWTDVVGTFTDVLFARVDSAGAMVGSAVRITDGTSNAQASSLVWAASEFGVAWNDDRHGDHEIFFARISASGAKIGTDTRITATTANSFNPALVWTGSEHAVAWEDARSTPAQVYLTRISSSGIEIGDELAVSETTSSATEADLAWTGSAFGLVWRDSRITGGWDIYHAAVSATGVKTGSDIRVTDTLRAYQPAISCSGSEFGVAYLQTTAGRFQTFFIRLDADGIPASLPTRIDALATVSSAPALAWNGSQYAMLWTEVLTGYTAVYASLLEPAGTVLVGDMPISHGMANADRSTIVWTGSEFGIAWHDGRDGNYEIYMNFILQCD